MGAHQWASAQSVELAAGLVVRADEVGGLGLARRRGAAGPKQRRPRHVDKAGARSMGSSGVQARGNLAPVVVVQEAAAATGNGEAGGAGW